MGQVVVSVKGAVDVEAAQERVAGFDGRSVEASRGNSWLESTGQPGPEEG